MLSIRNLKKHFDGIQAVNDFSLQVQAGKITSLIGPNGAGKTTVFNVVTGFLSASDGSVSLGNEPISNVPAWKIARLGVSRTFQNLRLFKKLTVEENVLLGRQNQTGEGFLSALFLFSSNSSEHRANLERVRALLEFVGLADEQHSLAQNLSYGQQKLLSIACCLATEPKLLLLDEPVSGVQPAMIERIAFILSELVKKERKTIFLIEHDIDFVLKYSDFVAVMDEGMKIVEGAPSVIKDNTEILEAYLT